MDLKYLEYNYSAFPLVSLIFTGLLVLLVLRLIRFAIPFATRNRTIRTWLEKYFAFFEMFVWVIVGVWFLPYLMQKHPFAGYGLAFILFALFVWIAWFGLKDIVAGFFMRSNGDIKIGDQIEIMQNEGTIIRMGHRTIVLDSANGNVIKLPYSQIINKPITKLSSVEIRHSHLFAFELNRVDNIQKLIQDINTRIIMNPRSSLVEKPKVELLKEEKGKLLFQIKIFAIEKRFLSIIEEDLRDHFSN